MMLYKRCCYCCHCCFFWGGEGGKEGRKGSRVSIIEMYLQNCNHKLYKVVCRLTTGCHNPSTYLSLRMTLTNRENPQNREFMQCHPCFESILSLHFAIDLFPTSLLISTRHLTSRSHYIYHHRLHLNRMGLVATAYYHAPARIRPDALRTSATRRPIGPRLSQDRRRSRRVCVTAGLDDPLQQISDVLAGNEVTQCVMS